MDDDSVGGGDSDDLLAQHLVHEFADFGQSAVEFVATARDLLASGDPQRQPRLGEAVSYCVREALKRILDSVERPGGGRWQGASRRVTAAKQQFDRVRGLPGGDEEGALDELLRRIDELEDLHNETGIHERRIIAVLVSRTGGVPLEARYELVVEYQALIEELNTAVHADSDLDSARARFDRALRVLKQLFLPPDVRLAELDELAAIADPTPEHAARVLDAVYAPNHLVYFFQRVVSARWLELLTESGVVTPPSGQSPWPVYRLIETLAATAGGELAQWLTTAYELWGDDPARALYLVRAAADVGSAGYDLLARAVSDHPQDGTICHTVEWALRDVPSSEPIIERAADHLLNPTSGLYRIAGVDHDAGILAKVVGGLTVDNAERRLELLAYKIRAIPLDESERRLAVIERAGSISDISDPYRHNAFTILLAGLIDAIKRCFGLGVDYQVVLSAVERCGPDVTPRLRAFALATAPDVDIVVAVEEVSTAIGQRSPTGDDLLLVNRIVSEAGAEQYRERWEEAFREAPEPAAIASALKDHSIDEGWLRARDWAAILPAECSTAWKTAIGLLSAAFGPVTRQHYEHRVRTSVRMGQSPMTVDQIAGRAPEEAASAVSDWRPDPEEWLVSARELARTLEEAVKREARRWIQSPIAIVAALREPIYISHYFRAIAQCAEDLGAAASDLVEAVGFCRSHPWEPIVLGRDDWDYDPDWQTTDAEGIRVLQKLADSDVGFASRMEQAWAMVLEAARDRTDESSILSPRDDALQTAINRPCTKALEAVISLMAYEFRASGTVRPEALKVLDEVLLLPDWDGAEHRAIIAPRLSFLLHVAREWVEERAELLFGTEAPGELGQATVDLVVKWGRPHRWVFENARAPIIDAVGRRVENAMSALLIGMLWEVEGYEPAALTARLAQLDRTLISDAGDALGRLLRAEDADVEHMKVGVAFWEAVLARSDLNDLAGFGWWSEVTSLDSVEWERLTLETTKRTGGRLDWSHAVAGRAAQPPISVEGLDILNQLVRGQVDEWDRLQVIETAIKALQAAGESLSATEEYIRLRTTLIERGRFDVRDL